MCSVRCQFMWSLLIVIVGLTVHAAQSAPAESSALQPIPALDYLSSWKRSVSIQQVQSQWKVSSIDKLSHVRTGNCVCLLWRGETSFKLTSVPFSSVSNQTLSLEYINYFTKRPILVKIVLKNNRSVEIASQTRRSEYKQEAIEQLSLTLPDYAKNQLQTIEVEFSVIKDESEPKSTITQTVLDAENVDSAVDANKYPDDKKGSGSEGKKDKPAEKADEDKENDEENKDYDEEEEEVNNNSHNHTINKLITIKLLDLRVADACHQNQQCLNEGVCRNRHANEFECQCPDNVNGQFCEDDQRSVKKNEKISKKSKSPNDSSEVPICSSQYFTSPIEPKINLMLYIFIFSIVAILFVLMFVFRGYLIDAANTLCGNCLQRRRFR